MSIVSRTFVDSPCTLLEEKPICLLQNMLLGLTCSTNFILFIIPTMSQYDD